MDYKLEDLLDIKMFQSLQDRLNEIYSFPSAIIDNDGKILTATAWQDICTKFHRLNKECEIECIKSDRFIEEHLSEADPAVSYKCPHGLIDNAAPIIIDGMYLGNFFTGQFFLEPPELNFFREQAARYGFDEFLYLEAVKKVPIWSKEQLNSYLYFIKGLIEVIAGIGLKNVKEIEANKKIKKSEEQYKTVIRTSHDGFWIVDREGNILVANDAYSRMSGYSIEEIVKMRISDMEAIEKVDEIQSHKEKLIEEGGGIFETRHQRKDRSIFDVEVSVNYIAEDSGRFYVFIRDISVRKKAETAIKDSEEKFRKLHEMSPVSIVLNLLETGEFLDSNQALWDITGYDEGEFRRLTYWDITPKEYEEQEAQQLELLRTIGKYGPYEKEYIRKDGSRVPVLLNGVRIKDNIGRDLIYSVVQDITALKIKEKALSIERDRAKQYFDTAAVLMVAMNVNGDIVSLNKKGYEILEHEEDELIGLNWFENFLPEYNKQYIRNIFKDLMSGKRKVTEGYENAIITITGKEILIRWHNSLLYDGNNNIVGILASGEDITEYKKAEEALKEAELKYRTIADYTYDMEFWKSPSEEFLYMSNSCKRITGYEVKEFLDDPDLFLKIIYPDDKQIWKKHRLEATQRMELSVAVFRIVRADGYVRWIEHCCNPVYDTNGYFIGTRGSNRDITERKNSEEALIAAKHRAEESEKLLKEAQSLAQLGYWSWDIPTNTINWSEEVYKINGLNPDEDIPKFEDMILRYVPESRNRMLSAVDKALEDGKPFELELELIRPDNTARWIVSKGNPVQDTNGKVFRIFGTVMDITERIEFEVEILKAKQKAEQSDKLKTSFLQNMSHEIRTPLNGIIGFSTLLKDWKDIIEDDRNSFIDMIITSSNRLLGIVNDVLELSRLDSGLVTAVPAVFSIEEFFRYFGNAFGKKIRDKGLRFIESLPSDCRNISLHTDKDKLIQILTNFITNAIKFTDKEEIEFGCNLNGAQLEIFVRDTGIGIKEEFLEKIFERFWQYEALTDRKFGGTGLGLSITRGLADILGVAIIVSSEYGTGSKFTIVLPNELIVLGKTGQPFAGAIQEILLDLKGIRILIVDDENINNHLFHEFFKREEVQISWVKNGKQAVDLVDKERFDIILMDLKMPIMDGLQATRLIKQRAPDLPIIAQTAYSHSEEMNLATEAGCDAFISKPIFKEQLFDIIRNLLKR
ncbi:MAG: Histidine kinase [Ignavibacteria bacterium]|nr:Histidine kinase [Ignavibacteria bacterium]